MPSFTLRREALWARGVKQCEKRPSVRRNSRIFKVNKLKIKSVCVCAVSKLLFAHMRMPPRLIVGVLKKDQWKKKVHVTCLWGHLPLGPGVWALLPSRTFLLFLPCRPSCLGQAVRTLSAPGLGQLCLPQLGWKTGIWATKSSRYTH